jgi:predicted RNA binding protein YcfA (HicA-like mRNA interferase family)
VPKLPGIPHLQAVRALEKAGFRVVRESKHIVMSNGQRILTIPRANPVNAFTMGGIVRDAGLTIEQFRELLCTCGRTSGCS